MGSLKANKRKTATGSKKRAFPGAAMPFAKKRKGK